jgi:methionine-rich copper-binding protein CopC
MKRVMLIFVLVAALSLGVFQVALAHAKLDHCTPAVDATVAQVPGQVVCVMSEEIDTKLSTLSVWDAGGVQVDKRDAHVDLNDPDHKTLIVSLDPAGMKDGIYTVKYHTVTPDDGGVTDGTFQFVAGSAATSAQPPLGTSSQALTSTVVTSTVVVTPTVAPTPAPAPSAQPPLGTPALAPQPTPAALPPTGGSQAAAGWMVGLGLLGLALAGGGAVIRRFTR